MNRIQRRNFLLGLSATGLASAGVAWLRLQPNPRERVLSQTLRRVLLPDVKLIFATTRALEDSVEQLLRMPARQQLSVAQRAWQSAVLAWERASALSLGPCVDTGALLQAAFWPARREAIDALIEDTSTVIDAELVTRLDVNAKGMFALERLLFDEPAATPAWLLTQPRALALAQALAHDVAAYADKVHGAFGDGSAFANDFARAGQQNLNRLVTQLLRGLETSTVRVANVLGTAANHSLSLDVVQGGRSGTSKTILLARLQVIERSYGAGLPASLASLVSAAAPRVDQHLRSLLSAAMHAVQSFAKPLDQVVRTDPAPLQAAWTQLRALEVALRTELASALGVTITFTSSDGD